MSVTGVFEAGTEHKADDIEEENLLDLDLDDRNASILAIQLHLFGK